MSGESMNSSKVVDGDSVNSGAAGAGPTLNTNTAAAVNNIADVCCLITKRQEARKPE